MQLAAVYSRVIDGEVLTFAASGWTYDDTFVLYDHQTESLWYHLSGEESMTCVDGVYKDRKLPELTSALTRWNNWLEDFPATKFLDYP